MDMTIFPHAVSGCLSAIPSKSYVHRALICASLADRPTSLSCTETNRDMDATAACLTALGATVQKQPDQYHITPIPRTAHPTDPAILDCGESGSTLRFLLPVAAALGRSSVFLAHGRLSERPLSPLFEELQAHGVTCSEKGRFPLSLHGQLTAGRFCLDGGVSSQFFTGLMLALPLLSAESNVQIQGRLESAPYLALTESVMHAFGVNACREGSTIAIRPQQFRSPGMLTSEGDWSNAAFWLVAGAIGGDITLTGLQATSRQGDRSIVSLLRAMGAQIVCTGETVRVCRSALHGIPIDATDIPDLVPILSIAAAAAQGETVITGAARLRLKESDRIQSVCAMLRAMDVSCTETKDGLCIQGAAAGSLPIRHPVTVDACNDHRIAMSAAIASLLCSDHLTICGAEAVEKSYPAFFRDFRAVGGHTQEARR